MQRNKKGDEQQHPHIVVKKRSEGGEEGHHGGVWKIAYADFMTAMMTFFLVMWLINAASKEKITQLASFFNPVKLSDRTAPAKGVRDNHNTGAEKENAASAGRSKKPPKPGAKPADPQEAEEDEVLFRNPQAVLTQLAQQAESAMAAAMTATNSNSFVSDAPPRDPFLTDPVISQPPRQTIKATPDGQEDAGAGPQPAANAQMPALQQTKPSVAPTQPAGAGLQSAENAPMPPAQEAKPATVPPQSAAAEKTGKAASPENEAAAGRLQKDLGKLIGELPEAFRPNVAAQATQEGVLISITDDINFSMFKIASSEPSPQLVLVMDRIGRLVGKYPGQIIVRGHTDGRQYAGDSYGNWRLSLNRANMAYFMLMRGKVDEKRFLAVEGYADRSLRNKADPLVGENRRIEILIKGSGT
jgi:chemotaxis protein MotB